MDVILQGEERDHKKVWKKTEVPIGWQDYLWKGIYDDSAIRHYYKNIITIDLLVILVPDSYWKETFHWFEKRIKLKTKI
jgi:hypothetical protein